MNTLCCSRLHCLVWYRIKLADHGSTCTLSGLLKPGLPPIPVLIWFTYKEAKVNTSRPEHRMLTRDTLPKQVQRPENTERVPSVSERERSGISLICGSPSLYSHEITYEQMTEREKWNGLERKSNYWGAGQRKGRAVGCVGGTKSKDIIYLHENENVWRDTV